MGVTELGLSMTIAFAIWTDWRQQKIYNALLVPAFLVAVGLQTYQKGWLGLQESLLGAGIGFLLMLIPYLLGGMGGGDVKFLAVIGAFGGVRFVLAAFLYGALCGGLISAILLARRQALLLTLKRFVYIMPFLTTPKDLAEDIRSARQEKFPYGFALGVGALLALFLG
ncbi:MAG: prepilin peptidase [Desulfitobacteriaceae bacterium]|nr:prepilin peptidase [Desulfitobacteriaceae bacterium]MDI6879374.1 prepilin peptidase [Desulfitobacteriaceae bacterium]MDI6913997.1 prepilin peptidase [Desulfitobacteriaceae bacterium]